MKRPNFFAFIYLFLFVFSACKYDIIETPTPEPDVVLAASDYSDEISTPEELTATQGGCKKVTLSWKVLPNAVQYQIYSAETPFDTFTQIAETADNSSSIEITEKSGITKYYKIKAVNYFGTVSDFSETIMGTTLATPLITSIDSTENGTVSTVHWWMENCSKTTYQDSVNYIITCYEEDETTVVGTVNAETDATSATFEELIPNTNYFYQVEAFLSTDQENVEKSDMLDAETARRLIPNAVEEFTTKQGISPEYVEISWKTPDFVDYALGKNSYEQHPVYFTLERKPLNAADTSYRKIISYIGVAGKDDDTESDQKIVFDCDKATSTSKNLSVSAGSGDSTELYPAYIPGSTLTYKDYSVERGAQYTYRITSYVDDASKTISSDNAVVTGDGWLIPISNFKLSTNYVKDGSFFKSITVSFSLDFNTLGKTDYSLIVVEKYKSFDGNTITETALTPIGNTTASINALKRTFDFSKSVKEGYYSYAFYIAGANETGKPAAPYDSVISPKKITVMKDAANLPIVENFQVSDGYSNKIVISWDYNENWTYSLETVDYNDKGIQIPDSEKSITIKAGTADGNTTVSNSLATYQDTITEGAIRRLYTLSINNNGVFNYISSDSISETLGTPTPVMANPDYTTISITWPKVQKATTYEISAYYIDDTQKSNPLITPDQYEYKNGTYVCSINAPAGFKDASKAGTPINFSVKAINTEKNTATDKTIKVFTLGPAYTKPEFDKTAAEENTIKLQWKKLPQVTDYLIYRPRYLDGAATTFEKADVYHYQVSTGKLFVQGEEIQSASASIDASDGDYFVLTEKQVSAAKNTSYDNNQAMLSWGLPYGYIVFPVQNEGDFSFANDSLELDSSSKIKYENISAAQCLAATSGYGIDVYADKAETKDSITISWQKPYIGTTKCSVYRRAAGSSNPWTKIADEITATTYNDTTLNGNELYKGWEYTVKYNTSDSTTTFSDSYLLNLAQADERYSKPATSEARNKGYTLNIEGFTAGTNSSDDFSETIKWKPWNTAERNLPPTSIKIYMDNKNLTTGWTALGEFEKTLSLSKPNGVNVTKSGSCEIKTTPVFVDDISTGYLMVLRDANHYYKLDITRNITKNESTEEKKISQGDDYSVYAQRAIKGKEFIKIGMLQYTNAIYEMCGGDNKWSNASSVTDKGYGSLSVSKSWGNITYSASGYKPVQPLPSGNTCNSIVALSMETGGKIWVENTVVGVHNEENYTNKINEKTVTIAPTSQIATSLQTYYSGSFKIKSDNSSDLTISSTKLSSDITASTQAARRFWLPVRFDDESNWWHNNEAGKLYGWWY